MPTAPTTPLAAYLRLQRASDREMLDALRVATSRVERELKRLNTAARIGERMQKEQLRRTQIALHREMTRLWSNVGDTVEANISRAAAEGAANMLAQSESLVKTMVSQADYDTMVASARAQASRGVDILQERLSGSSAHQLAQSVYQNASLANGQIDKLINNALARGASAAELAKDVRAFINPSVRGGVSYAAMRLGRTELNNAFHAAAVREARAEPWTRAMKWNLSGSHPKPDECNDYAERTHMSDGNAGEWKPEEVPGKPHPNCLCYVTPIALRRDAFIRQHMRGEQDEYMRSRGVQQPLQAGPGTAPQSAFPRLAKPESYQEALQKANPGIKENFGNAREQYRTNCHQVVNAMEMRARGYDVVARPTFDSNGRYCKTIANDWVNPKTGRHGQFNPLFLQEGETNRQAILASTEHWPPGARGYVSGAWQTGSAHIFNVYKDEAGALRFVDGQVQDASCSGYLDRMVRVQLMRVDDLEPVMKRMDDSVSVDLVKVTAETQLEHAERLVAQLEEDLEKPTGFYKKSLQDMLYRLRTEMTSLAKSVR